MLNKILDFFPAHRNDTKLDSTRINYVVIPLIFEVRR